MSYRSRSVPRKIIRKHPNLLNYINTYLNPLAICKPRTIKEQLNLDSNDLQFMRSWLTSIGSSSWLDFDNVNKDGNNPINLFYIFGYNNININLDDNSYYVLILEMKGKFIKNVFYTTLNTAGQNNNFNFKSDGKNYLIYIFKSNNINNPFQLLNNGNLVLTYTIPDGNVSFTNPGENPIEKKFQLDGYGTDYIMYKGSIQFSLV